jgi:hypothetical protein
MPVTGTAADGTNGWLHGETEPVGPDEVLTVMANLPKDARDTLLEARVDRKVSSPTALRCRRAPEM